MQRFLSRILPTLPPTLRVFCAASVALTLIGIVARFVCAHLLHLPEYPYRTYVLPHDGDGIDLMIFYVRFQKFHSRDFFSPAGGSVYAYPAAVAPLYWLFYRVRYAQIPFLLVGTGTILALARAFVRALQRRGVSLRDAYLFTALSLLCSYPLYFEFTRGNMELFMWLLSAASVYAILRDRPWLGAALLGISIAMKLYPFMLLGLLLSRRKYLPVAFSLAVAVAYSLFSLWAVCPDIGYAWKQINDGVQQFQVRYVIAYWPLFIGVDHSLFAVIKRALGYLSRPQYAHILTGYMATCGLLGLIAYFARIRKLPVLNQVLCLTVASILLPPVSFDYTLIHLYTPFVLWVLYLVRQDRSGLAAAKGTRALLLCFIVLLAQVGEVISHGDRLGGQIKAVALLVLFVLGLWYPLRSEFDRSAAAGAVAAA